MTMLEYVSHFSLWAALKAPLLVGTDVTNMSPETKFILTNPEVIAVNQDPLGVSIHLHDKSLTKQTWVGPLFNNTGVFILFNPSILTQMITLDLTSIGLSDQLPCLRAGGCVVRDLWARKVVGTSYTGSFSSIVHAHAVFMGKICNDVNACSFGSEENIDQ